MIELPKGVFRVRARGRTYWYYQPGRGTAQAGERIRIRGEHERDPEFLRHLAELSGRAEPAPEVRRGSFAALIKAYTAGPDYAALKPRTRIEYDRHLATIDGLWGDMPVRGLRPRAILAMRDSYADTPTKANHILEVLSALIGWGIPRDYADANPCRDIPKFRKGAGYAAWRWDQIELFRREAAPHLWHAAALALYTGQRIGDVLGMKWSDIRAGEVHVVQDKTGKAVWVPIHKELAEVLETIERRSIYILTTGDGQPWAGGFHSSWKKQMRKKALADMLAARLVPHGLRKSAVVMMLEAGCTVPQVAAITGQSHQMVEHYAAMVSQRTLAREAILKWEESGR